MRIIKNQIAVFVLIFLLFISGCAVQPPHETGNFKSADLVELIKLDSTLKLDIRYATSNNFVGKPVYDEARAFLQRPAAMALIKVNTELKSLGYGLLIFDGYRPWRVTKLFWEITPKSKREFVADPRKGSRHNRGCAVDLTLYDLKSGREVEMTSGYDEMNERSHPGYKGGTETQRNMRDLLRTKMEANNFTVYDNEWWHFDYKEWKLYAIYDIPFSEIK